MVEEKARKSFVLGAPIKTNRQDAKNSEILEKNEPRRSPRRAEKTKARAKGSASKVIFSQ